MNNYCVSTSTSQYPLGIFDEGANEYHAVNCPVSVTPNITVDNPAANMYNGLVVLFFVFAFVVWYFTARFKLS